MEVWFVHVQVAQQFEDLYVKAATWEDAVKLARKQTKLDVRWATFSC